MLLKHMTLRRYTRIRDVLIKRQYDLTILAEDVYKPHNLSAMLRSCDAVGIAKAHAINPTGGVPTYNETSASADKWVELQTHEALEPALSSLRSQNMKLYAAHLSSSALDYRALDYTEPTCILFGNERSGVSERAAEAADAHIIVPMLGMVESLNVSVATAVILFEAQRQRLAAGKYDVSQLGPQALNARLFELLYPRAAKELKNQGLPYPVIDEAELADS